MVRFGIQVRQEGLSFDVIKQYFKDFESLDFYSAFVNDHFHPTWNPNKAPILENWVLLSALATATSKIRIGTLVNCNSFRYPSVLAKMAASLDVISQGRLEFMIGAGWYEAEYEGYGIPFPALKVRIKQMKEAIQVIKKMWTEDKAFFKGKYYYLRGALSYPKPVQQPYPRIWVGGSGEKLTIKAIAQVGEGTNFEGSPEDLERKLKILKNYCSEIGRDYEQIEKSWLGHLIIGSNETDAFRELKRMSKGGKHVDSEGLKGFALIGSPREIINQIEGFLKMGIDYFIIRLASESFDFINRNSLKLFSEKVMAAFK